MFLTNDLHMDSMNLVNVVLFVTQDTTLQAINLPSVSIFYFHPYLPIISLDMQRYLDVEHHHVLSART
jgi:hypothetical protein